ncbi:unnamed protein product [Trichobilharzia regenti]|nr:unnamed protein product [Trichobilharzia regenti]
MDHWKDRPLEVFIVPFSHQDPGKHDWNKKNKFAFSFIIIISSNNNNKLNYPIFKLQSLDVQRCLSMKSTSLSSVLYLPLLGIPTSDDPPSIPIAFRSFQMSSRYP